MCGLSWMSSLRSSNCRQVGGWSVGLVCRVVWCGDEVRCAGVWWVVAWWCGWARCNVYIWAVLADTKCCCRCRCRSWPCRCHACQERLCAGGALRHRPCRGALGRPVRGEGAALCCAAVCGLPPAAHCSLQPTCFPSARLRRRRLTTTANPTLIALLPRFLRAAAG